MNRKNMGNSAEKPYAVGVDLGGTTVKMGLFRLDGSLAVDWEIVTDKSEKGRNILPDIAKSIRQMLENKGIEEDRVEGVGIGVPGAVTNKSIVNGCANIGWDIVNVSGELSSHLGGMKVVCANDANTAALGELWQGAAKGRDTLVMITLGTGVGAGIIVNGRILEGACGAAGEIGHICLNPDEEKPCGCGKKGHLEQYASATGIACAARRALTETDEPSLLRGVPDLETKDIFDAAKEGDAFALRQVEQVGRTLGRALAIIACVIDPEVFLIGGGVSKAGNILTDTITKYYREFAFHSSEETPIMIASLGSRAGIYGAAKLILQED